MSTWTVGGVEVRSGGETDASDEDDCVVLDALRVAEAGAAQVDIDPAPATRVVDIGNDWLLDRYLKLIAKLYDLPIETDYEPSDDDMPPDVKAYVDACARLKSPPETIF